MQTSLNIKIGGQAGEGIKTTGLILSKVFARLGFHIFSYDEYPSLIRGGHNSYQMIADYQPVYSQRGKIDFLIALDKASTRLHQHELKKDGKILYDPDEFKIDQSAQGLIAVPWNHLATQTGGSKIMSNMVSLGAILSLSGLPLEPLFELIEQVFAKKGPNIINNNKKAAQAGFDYLKTNFPQENMAIDLPDRKELIVVLGNEAIASSAIASGMKYFAAYPMTPTSNILHFLAEHAQEYKLVVNHTENEIAAINTSLGASVSGVRAMTATSGGGFCLMAEGLGMAGMAEIPLVVVLGTRPGPSSGMPTWTGQGDLRFALHASHDEFPKVVLTPGDGFEAFNLTRSAFELAEQFQLPIILLVDKVICESHYSGPPFAKENNNHRTGFLKKIDDIYLRYQVTDSGVSKRPKPGQKGSASLIANSYEHGQDGLVTENPQERKEQMDKRLRKLDSLGSSLWELPIYGDPNAPLTLLGFGSTAGPVREALKELAHVNYLHFNYVWPFPEKQVKKVLSQAEKVVCIEGNATGQLASLIAQQTGFFTKNSLRKYDGRPFYPEEIVEFIKTQKNLK